MEKPKYSYIWLFCAFAALGACQYGYDGMSLTSCMTKELTAITGVYFSGIQAMSTFVRHFGRRRSDGSYEIPASDLSIMSSMINVGELVGSLGAAPLNDRMGRKGAFFCAAIIAVVGTVLQVTTDHDRDIITVGRVVLGLGVGIFLSTSPLYIGVSGYQVAGHFLDRSIDKLHLGSCSAFNERAAFRLLAAHDLDVSDHRCCHQPWDGIIDFDRCKLSPIFSSIKSWQPLTFKSLTVCRQLLS